MNNILILLGVFAALSIMGMPIAFSLCTSSIFTLIFIMDVPLIIVVEKLQLGVDSFLLLAVPMFILAANIMSEAGVTSRIYNFARATCGFLPGGLGHANVVGSVVFAGISGSAVADGASLGKMEIEEMVRAGYPKSYSAAMSCASATVGPIIPPSIPMVIYAGIANVSVGRMFLGGVTPGILLAAALMILNHFFAVKHNFPKDVRLSPKEIFKTFIASFLPLMTPVVILSGILFGFFTPTEAAAVAILYSCILGFFVYRELTFKKFPKILLETIVTSGVVLFIISGASLFAWILTVNQLGSVVAYVASLMGSRIMFLLVFNVILIFLGMIMEETALLIVLTPFLIPAAQHYGVDLVFFGIMMVLNLMISLATPPFGAGLFTACQVSGLKLEKLSKAMLPFVPVMLAVLFLMIFFPQIAMWLPDLIMGK